MLAEYKLRHGVVLCSLLSEAAKELTIKPLDQDGRLTNYLINGSVALHIKHATQRLSPWRFGFTEDSHKQLQHLALNYNTFVALVCGGDGLCALSADETLKQAKSGQALWLRATRRARHQYTIFGPRGELDGKFEMNLRPVVQALQ